MNERIHRLLANPEAAAVKLPPQRPEQKKDLNTTKLHLEPEANIERWAGPV